MASTILTIAETAKQQLRGAGGSARSVIDVQSPRLQKDGDRVGWMRSVMSGLPKGGVGPFLMLDHWGGAYGPREAVSGSDHPHRGQETVSYIVQGGIHHEDSAGNEGFLREGWVQWMTAGSGVMHSEMHVDELWEKGGTCEGFQLWVNLLAKDKMVDPKYQDTPPDQIPKVQTPDGLGTISVIAGKALGTAATITTRTPLMYLDVALEPRGAAEVGVPPEFDAFGYVFRGACAVAGRQVKAGQLFVLGPGESVSLSNGGDEQCRALLLGGSFPDEPVAWHGPFVMNTQEQIRATMNDYNQGKFGTIKGWQERDAKRREARDNISRRLASGLPPKSEL